MLSLIPLLNLYWWGKYITCVMMFSSLLLFNLSFANKYQLGGLSQEDPRLGSNTLAD
jgi:hypothetical protein